MLTTRCTSFNLLNYINQKNIPHKITYNFCKDRHNTNFLNWEATFEFNGKTYNGVGRSKQRCVASFMKQAEQDIFASLHNSSGNN